MCLDGEESTGSTLAVLLQDEITRRTNSLVGIPPSRPAPEVPATYVSAVPDVPPGRAEGEETQPHPDTMGLSSASSLEWPYQLTEETNEVGE